MKTYLPQIERRILVRPNQTFGILNYDMDNAYPQRMLELVAASPTAKDCWNKRAKFIAGNGFEEAGLSKQLINSKGLTLAKLLKAIATEKALFTGFGIHINYNANFKISSVNYIKFEDIRMGDTDCPETADKFAIYSDWGRKTWKNIMRSKITFLDKYAPDPNFFKTPVETIKTKLCVRYNEYDISPNKNKGLLNLSANRIIKQEIPNKIKIPTPN